MDWFTKTLQVAGALLALLILAGGAWALIRGSFNKARVTELREDNDDLRKRLGDVEAKNAASEIREHALAIKVEHQQNEINMLTEMITQRAEVGSLSQAMVDLLGAVRVHNDEARDHWANMDVAFTALINKEGKS